MFCVLPYEIRKREFRRIVDSYKSFPSKITFPQFNPRLDLFTKLLSFLHITERQLNGQMGSLYAESLSIISGTAEGNPQKVSWVSPMCPNWCGPKTKIKQANYKAFMLYTCSKYITLKSQLLAEFTTILIHKIQSLSFYYIKGLLMKNCCFNTSFARV